MYVMNMFVSATALCQIAMRVCEALSPEAHKVGGSSYGCASQTGIQHHHRHDCGHGQTVSISSIRYTTAET